MNSHKLSSSEHHEMLTIVESYRDLETSLTKVQEQLESLSSLKDTLLSNLETIRARELKFFEDLEKTHGKGKLDLYTFEYIKEKTPNESTNSNLRVVS
jgi:hypothetical protein